MIATMFQFSFERDKTPNIQLGTVDTADINIGVPDRESPIAVVSSKPAEIELEPTDGGGVEFTVGTGVAPGETYPGPYTVTPNGRTQTLATRNLTLTGNITVNPIPQNYGLITWNGAFLTVS